MYELYIANKNYSSWSLRPWVLMHEAGIELNEHLIPFGDPGWENFRRLSPSGKVPCLVDGKTVVWDSLAIVEYLAERHRNVWPREAEPRAWARSAAAEMHSGFIELRNRCSMSCGVRMRLKETPPALKRDLARLDTLWNEGLEPFRRSVSRREVLHRRGCLLRAGRIPCADLWTRARARAGGLLRSDCSSLPPCGSGIPPRSPRSSAMCRTKRRFSRCAESHRGSARPRRSESRSSCRDSPGAARTRTGAIPRIRASGCQS